MPKTTKTIEGSVDLKSAPYDTPLLTDDGVALKLRELLGIHPNRKHVDIWFHCDSGGNLFSCVDEGRYHADPSIWSYLPEIEEKITNYN